MIDVQYICMAHGVTAKNLLGQYWASNIVPTENSSSSVVSDFLRKPLCFAPCGFSNFVPVTVAARHDSYTGYTFPCAFSFIEGHVQFMAAQPAKFWKVQNDPGAGNISNN